MWITPPHDSARSWQPSGREPLPWRAIAVYLAVYLALDWVSYIRPFQGLNITLWNPQPALAIALLMISRRLWWVVTIGLLAAEFLVRGLPADFVVVSVAAGALALSYLVIALALQRQLVGGRLGSARDVLWFLGIVAAGSILSAAVYVGTYATGSVLPVGPVWPALARYWVGDAVGMTVTLPLLLVAMDPARRDDLLKVLRHRQWWVTAAFTLLLLWWFAQSGVQFSYAYLLLLPVIGASMRFGSPGAVLSAALTQVGLIVALQAGPHQDMLVVELQLLMAAITMTGLLLGITVEERARADAELRRTLRLAAAGHMSAALAHELSQPLTALSTYAQTCEMLVREGELLSAERWILLLDALRRITVDARRAGEVVKRLRDFFQSGATQLRPCDLRSLVQAELALQHQRSAASGTSITLQAEDDLPLVWLDEVQIQVVVRNLIANALDAADGPNRPGRVAVRIGQGAGELLVEVTDSGPGVSTDQAQTVFDFGSSNKVGGMGVGLGISRALVEAHGGRLWAIPGASGHFCFTLPTDRFEIEATATPD